MFAIRSLMPPFLSHTCHHSSPLFPAPYPQFTPQNSMLLQLSWAPRLSRVVILIQMAYSSHHLADGQGGFKKQCFSLPCIVKEAAVGYCCQLGYSSSSHMEMSR